MWEILTAKVPFSENKNLDIMHKVTKVFIFIIGKVAAEEVRPGVPENCNSILKDLMIQSWHSIPSKRPTFKHIVFVLLDAQWMNKSL